LIITTIGTRGLLFTFPELSGTNVYVIRGHRHYFICDTFLGPEPMLQIRSHLEANFGRRPYVVFNSHADWDHIWGNAAFPDSLILAHQEAPRRMRAEWERDVHQYSRYMKGRVEMTLPNMVFDSTVAFPDDQVVFFHTPGHTLDSSSCMDTSEAILFAGDNVEEPIPYLYQPDIHLYQRSLSGYMVHNPTIVIPGHGAPGSLEIVERNSHYLGLLMRGILPEGASDEARSRHTSNLRTLVQAGWGFLGGDSTH